MKVNRTYSMDYDLVIKLAKKQNQSLEVCKAVRKHLDGIDKVSLEDFTDRQLIAALQSRFQKDSAEFNLIITLLSVINQ